MSQPHNWHQYGIARLWGAAVLKASDANGLLYDITTCLLTVVDDLRTLTELDPETLKVLSL
jgi:hypothetical protein